MSEIEDTSVMIYRQRRLVDNKASMLKTFVSFLAVMGGFGSTFLSQLPIPTDFLVSEYVILLFGGLSALFVSMTFISLIICTMLLVAIHNFNCNVQDNADDFPEFWRKRCESDWLLAFQIFVLSIPIFFANVMLVGSIQFRVTFSAKIAVIVVTGSFLVFILFRTIPKWKHVAQSQNNKY